MKTIIKTALITMGIFTSASIFAQNVDVNASAQVNAEPNGLLQGVTGAVKNTVQGVSQAGQTAVHKGVTATQKTVDAASHAGANVIHKTGETVKNGKDFAVDKAEAGKDLAADKIAKAKALATAKAKDGKAFAAEKKAEVKAQIQDKKDDAKKIHLDPRSHAQTNVQGQTGVNVGVKALGVDANVNTNIETK